MLRRTFSRSLIALSLGLTFGHTAVAQTYPSRPITMVVPWGAGGGTDATARIVAAMMEKEMGQPVNVVNRTGGNGVVGHSAIASAPADGYTLGMITVEISMMHWAGLTDLKPTNYTPLAPQRSRCGPTHPTKPSTICWPPSRPTRANSKPRAPVKAAFGIWLWRAC